MTPCGYSLATLVVTPKGRPPAPDPARCAPAPARPAGWAPLQSEESAAQRDLWRKGRAAQRPPAGEGKSKKELPTPFPR